MRDSHSLILEHIGNPELHSRIAAGAKSLRLQGMMRSRMKGASPLQADGNGFTMSDSHCEDEDWTNFVLRFLLKIIFECKSTLEYCDRRRIYAFGM